MHTHLPYSTCMVVFSEISNPMLLSALHLKTSPLLASVILIVGVFPLVGSGDPLRNHVMVTGGVPLTILQYTTTLNPLLTYTGVPILTPLLPIVITDGLGTNDPLSMTGGSTYVHNTYTNN